MNHNIDTSNNNINILNNQSKEPSFIKHLNNNLIKSVEIWIGNELFDKYDIEHQNKMINIWSELANHTDISNNIINNK